MVDFARLARDKRADLSPEQRREDDSTSVARQLAEADSVVIPALFNRRVNSVDDPRPHDRDQVRVELERGAQRHSGPVDLLHFRGGSTGYESFQLDDHMWAELTGKPIPGGFVRAARGAHGDRMFPICGGSDSYLACRVDSADVLRAIEHLDAAREARREAAETVRATVSLPGEEPFDTTFRVNAVAGLTPYGLGSEATGVTLDAGETGRMRGFAPLPLVSSHDAVVDGRQVLDGGPGGLVRVALRDPDGRTSQTGFATVEAGALRDALSRVDVVEVAPHRLESPRWEQNRRQPDPAAVALFEAADRDGRVTLALDPARVAALGATLDAAALVALPASSRSRDARPARSLADAYEAASPGAAPGLRPVTVSAEAAIAALGAMTPAQWGTLLVGLGREPDGARREAGASLAASPLARDGVLPLLASRAELAGEDPSHPVARAVRLLTPAVAQPEFDAAFERTGRILHGEAGVASLRDGFGKGSGNRRLHFDVARADALASAMSPTDAAAVRAALALGVERDAAANARRQAKGARRESQRER